jgi:hypothetical protein
MARNRPEKRSQNVFNGERSRGYQPPQEDTEETLADDVLAGAMKLGRNQITVFSLVSRPIV